MSDIHIHRTHALGLEGARQIADKWAKHVQTKFDVSCQPTQVDGCEAIEFSRSGMSGVMKLGADFIELEAKLGFLFKAFARQAEAEVAKQLDESLAKAAAKKG